MKSSPEKLLKKHEKLIQSDGLKVVSHVQRPIDEGYLHTLMIDNVSTPFKFVRTKKYKSLQGQRVNLTYYPKNETVAGMDFQVMKVVRIKVS
jgi:hypothetical protein